ncbi:MAG: nucleotide exchange factor GrpE [Deltaproteobacteria bacterium CG07_land_8_20_14_0_80_60_11]|nr:MAG: nucleotide exchange factor GrpE [Deltaproteobacteria bacterium CG07_land_8_20_14_0_80_60_11]
MTRRKGFMNLSKSDSFIKGSPESKSREEKAAPEVLHESPEVSGDLAELHQKLLEKTGEAEENYTRLLRLAADMENLRKRQERERAELLQFANENLIKELLPVVDNLERALDHGRQLEAPEALLEGIERVYQGFLKVLDRFGVTPFDSVGQHFDPALHNAMMQEEAPGVPDCRVIKELQKGYLMNQRLLRPAMVVVARNTPNENTSGPNDSTVQEEN